MAPTVQSWHYRPQTTNQVITEGQHQSIHKGPKRGNRDDWDNSNNYKSDCNAFLFSIDKDKIVEQDEPLHAGDCTWHHGWCLHSAPDLFDDEKKDRVAYTASYVKSPSKLLDEKVLGRQDGEDSISYEGWVNDVTPGDVIDHELLPLVWPPHEQE